MNRRTFLVALAAGSGALVACQPIAAPATPDRGSVLLVDNGGEAAPLRLGLVQPAWTPVRLSLDSSVDAEIDNDGNDLPKGYQDPAGGREAAGRLFAKGVDVIFAAGGVTADGALAASQDQGVLAIAGERSLDAAVASPTTLLAAV